MPERNVRPTDVFPRRNLPGSAEQWGRVMEDRVKGTEEAVVAQRQDLQGLNRNTASQLEGISTSLNRLASGIFSASNFAQGNGPDLYGDGPGFDTPLAGVTITRPDWASRVIITATSALWAYTVNEEDPLFTMGLIQFSAGSPVTESPRLSFFAELEFAPNSRTWTYTYDGPVDGNLSVVAAVESATAGAAVSWSAQLAVFGVWYP